MSLELGEICTIRTLKLQWWWFPTVEVGNFQQVVRSYFYTWGHGEIRGSSRFGSIVKGKIQIPGQFELPEFRASLPAAHPFLSNAYIFVRQLFQF